MRRLTVLLLVGMLAVGLAPAAFGQALPLNSVGSARLPRDPVRRPARPAGGHRRDRFARRCLQRIRARLHARAPGQGEPWRSLTS